MTILISFAALAVHLALMLLLAPLAVGAVRWMQARLLGRAGAPVWQNWRGLLRLARKQAVVAESASWLFRAAPVAVFAATLAAAALVPGFALGMATAPLADLIAIAGLLALARCTLVLAGLDTGAAPGGMGGSRLMAAAVFAEPALLLVIFCFALLAGSSNLDAVAMALREGAASLVAPGLALPALLAVAVAANGRFPADGQAAPAEPGMAAESMMLAYSGRDLALLEAAAALQLLLWLTLIATLFVPFGVATAEAGLLVWLLALPVWVVKLGVLAGLLALFETVLAGISVPRVQEMLGLAVLLGLLAALFALVSQGLA